MLSWWRHSLQKPILPLPRKSVCPAQGLLQEGIVQVLCLIRALRLMWYGIGVMKHSQTWTVKCWKRDRCFHPEIWVHRCSLSMLKWKKNGLFIWLLTNYSFKSLQNRNFCVMHHLFLVRTQDTWEAKSISSGVEEILKPSGQKRTRVTTKIHL